MESQNDMTDPIADHEPPQEQEVESQTPVPVESQGDTPTTTDVASPEISTNPDSVLYAALLAQRDTTTAGMTSGEKSAVAVSQAMVALSTGNSDQIATGLRNCSGKAF